MIRNNFLLVLLTFNFSPLLFSPIINIENVLSTGSLVGSKSWLSYKGSWFHLHQKAWTSITKSIQIKGSYSLCEKRNINTCSYHQYYNISALWNTNKHFKKHLQNIRACLHRQQPRPSAQKELPSPFPLTRTWRKISLSALASVKASEFSSPERGTGLMSWSARRCGDRRNVKWCFRCCVLPQLSDMFDALFVILAFFTALFPGLRHFDLSLCFDTGSPGSVCVLKITLIGSAVYRELEFSTFHDLQQSLQSVSLLPFR